MSRVECKKKASALALADLGGNEAEAPKMRKRKSALWWYYTLFGQGCQGARAKRPVYFGWMRFLTGTLCVFLPGGVGYEMRFRGRLCLMTGLRDHGLSGGKGVRLPSGLRGYNGRRRFERDFIIMTAIARSNRIIPRHDTDRMK